LSAAELRLHACEYRTVRTRRAAAADGSLTMIMCGSEGCALVSTFLQLASLPPAWTLTWEVDVNAYWWLTTVYPIIVEADTLLVTDHPSARARFCRGVR
jgi:hypothetical protein